MASIESGSAGRSSIERFSDRVEDYARYRPSYAPGLVREIAERVQLSRDRSICADIGAGTGIFSRLLAEFCAGVLAIEPNAAMRSRLEMPAADVGAVEPRDGTAEDTGLPDGGVDLVTCAQSFHWFDVPRTRREFRRILRPPYWVALVWNERRIDGSPFLDGYEELLNRFCPEYPRVVHRHRSPERMAALFGHQDYEERSWDYGQVLDLEAVRGRLFSSSYVPKEAEDPGHPMSRLLNELFSECQSDGTVEMLYSSTLYLGRLG